MQETPTCLLLLMIIFLGFPNLAASTRLIFKPQNCEGRTGDPRSFAPVQQNVSFAPETLLMGPHWVGF